jgi:hypothetical protein
VTAEDAGDAALRDIDAELSKFPDDAEVAPAGVLTSEPQDQLRYDLKLWITHSSEGATYLPR